MGWFEASSISLVETTKSSEPKDGHAVSKHAVIIELPGDHFTHSLKLVFHRGAMFREVRIVVRHGHQDLVSWDLQRVVIASFDARTLPTGEPLFAVRLDFEQIVFCNTASTGGQSSAKANPSEEVLAITMLREHALRGPQRIA